MRDAGRRPMGRLFYWALIGLTAAFGFGLPALGAAPQNGAPTTTVADTVYLADGTTAAGTLILTWPAFVTGIEGMCQSKSGAEKKDAAMSFLENALAMSDAIASREIVQPEQFTHGISQIVDGVVLCMNSSVWAKNGAKATASLPTSN